MCEVWYILYLEPGAGIVLCVEATTILGMGFLLRTLPVLLQDHLTNPRNKHKHTLPSHPMMVQYCTGSYITRVFFKKDKTEMYGKAYNVRRKLLA